MPDQRELQILCHLRENSRQSITSISRKTSIPISTVFDKVKKLEKIITKHTSLIDFSQLGYNFRVAIFVKVHNKTELRRFLMNHKNINSLHRISRYDYFAEAIFKNISELYDFKRNTSMFSIEKMEHYFIEEDVKRESFSGIFRSEN